MKEEMEFTKHERMNNQFGYIRETHEMAAKAVQNNPHTVFTPLMDYLDAIFPSKAWIHDKPFGKRGGKIYRIRPDFLCEEEKLIVEYDGLQHYTNPMNIRKDRNNQAIYESFGYKVVRIPYFIQLTNEVVKEMFGVEATLELASPSLPSMSAKWANTPAFCCPAGVERMARELQRYPQQYAVNIKQLTEDDDDELSGLSILKSVMANESV